MRIQTVITGTKPLMMHNIQLANPDNVWTKRIAQFTSKKKKTEDDRKAISDLEWRGSLYVHEGIVVIPTANVLKSFIESAKITKMGKSVARALSPFDIVVPLIYSGPQDIEELQKHDDFRDLTSVGVGRQRVVRTRPIFRAWGLSVEWELLTEVLDFDDFGRVANQAGIVEGLGDNRVNGYGRYTVKIEAAAAHAKPSRKAA